MTVIAYRDGVLVGDKLTHLNGMKGRVTKIFRRGDDMVGVAGTMTLALEMVQWLHDGADPKQLPAFQKTADDSQQLMVIRERKIWLYEWGHTPFEAELNYYAIGSGAPYAMAAMWCGKNAIEAVVCASELNTSCGMGMDILRDKAAEALAV